MKLDEIVKVFKEAFIKLKTDRVVIPIYDTLENTVDTYSISKWKQSCAKYHIFEIIKKGSINCKEYFGCMESVKQELKNLNEEEYIPVNVPINVNNNLQSSSFIASKTKLKECSGCSTKNTLKLCCKCETNICDDCFMKDSEGNNTHCIYCNELDVVLENI